MHEIAGKMPVEKPVDMSDAKRAQLIESELYPKLPPDAPELIAGIDEADDIGEIPDG